MEEVLGQPVITNSAIVTFDIRILLRIAGLDKNQCNAVFLRPDRQGGTDVFRTIGNPPSKSGGITMWPINRSLLNWR